MKRMKRMALTLVLLLVAVFAVLASPQRDCQQDCLDDYIAQRNFCATLPPAQRLACYNQAQAAYQECLNDCP